MNSLNQFFFGIYPYIALTVFLLGSLARFEREQYTWKTDSSQPVSYTHLDVYRDRAGIRHDDRVGAQRMRGIDRLAPFVAAARLHEGVDGEQHLAVPAVRQLDAGADVAFGEIEPGEVAGVGGVLQAQVDGCLLYTSRCV